MPRRTASGRGLRRVQGRAGKEECWEIKSRESKGEGGESLQGPVDYFKDFNFYSSETLFLGFEQKTDKKRLSH